MTGGRGRAPRIGVWGLLGSGNIGNDGSLESMLGYLRAAYPGAVIDAMCTGPDGVSAQFGIGAVPLLWCQRYEEHAPRLVAAGAKAAGKLIDVARISWWTRRHDAVIISGAGVLEASLPLHPWGLPYALLVLGAAGRLSGTPVALVSVGAADISKRATRLLCTAAARLARYRSYRDEFSRDAMTRRGLDTSADPVYHDLVYALPLPAAGPPDPMTVAVGVMAFYGGNDDRRQAGEIYAAYVEGMKTFVRWLVGSGRHVRLLTGDQVDSAVADEIVRDIRQHFPDLDQDWVIAPRIGSLAGLVDAIGPAATVVAARYHNLIAAAKLARPAISVSYSPKHDVLMADLGLPEYCVPARWLDAELLIRRFEELEKNSARLSRTIAERTAGKADRLAVQFARLSATLLPGFEVAAPGPAAGSR